MTNSDEKSVEIRVGEFVKVDGDQVRQHLDELVRTSLKETLNAMLSSVKESW